MVKQCPDKLQIVVLLLFRLCELTGQELSQEQQEQIVAAYPAEEATMLEMKQAAESLGVAFAEVQTSEPIGVEASLDAWQLWLS